MNKLVSKCLAFELNEIRRKPDLQRKKRGMRVSFFFSKQSVVMITVNSEQGNDKWMIQEDLLSHLRFFFESLKHSIVRKVASHVKLFMSRRCVVQIVEGIDFEILFEQKFIE